MITTVVYSEAGGTYKTTMAANLAVSLARMGKETLVIDLDPQKGNLSSLFGVGDMRESTEADNLVKHILGMPDGDFEALIEQTDEGVDVIPSHDMLGDFTSNLEQKITYETGMKNISRDEFPRYKMLHDLLWKQERIQEKYDAVIIDPNARAEDLLYNSIYALRTIVAPVDPAGKGRLGLEGLESLVGSMEEQLEIDVGLSCVVPVGVRRMNAHQKYCKEFEDADGLPIPVIIGERKSMMDEMWEARGSAYKVIEERWKNTQVGRDDEQIKSTPGMRKIRPRELETLQNIYELAYFITTETFNEEGDPVLRLDIDGKGTREYDVTGESMEVGA